MDPNQRQCREEHGRRVRLETAFALHCSFAATLRIIIRVRGTRSNTAGGRPHSSFKVAPANEDPRVARPGRYAAKEPMVANSTQYADWHSSLALLMQAQPSPARP